MDTEAVTLVSNALSLKTQWVESRDVMLATATGIAGVQDAAGLEAAGALLAKMRKHRKELEAERKAVTDPAREWITAIMDQEKALAAPLEAEVARVKKLTDDYATREAARLEAIRREEARKAAEAEARRQAEEREARRKAQAAIDQANAEERAKLAAAEKARQDEAARQRAIAEAEARAKAALAPKPAALATTANRFVTRWSFEVIDATSVPRMFCAPDPAAIRRYMSAAVDAGQEPEMRGVKFVKTVSTERKA